jgi:hypothetical protein
LINVFLYTVNRQSGRYTALTFYHEINIHHPFVFYYGISICPKPSAAKG